MRPFFLFSLFAVGGLTWAQSSAGPSAHSPVSLDVVQTHEHAPPEKLSSVRLVSWNIDHGSNLQDLVAALSEDRADLCLLQEVDWGTARTGGQDVAEALGKQLHLNSTYGIEFEELSQEHDSMAAYIGQATLTKLPILRSRVLRFEHQSAFWKPHAWIPSSVSLFQRRSGGRVALVTEVELGGRLLVVYNVHLESRSYGRIQNQQLDEILVDMQRHYPADVPAVLGGDLNTKYFPSIFLRKLEKAGFRSSLGERIERTHRVAFALDWIFVRGAVRLEQGSVEKAWKGSDHYALRAELATGNSEKIRK